MKAKRDYALYKGDRFVDLGTAEYLSSLLGIKKKSLLFFATPTYRKRSFGSEDKRMIVILIED